MAKIWLQWSIDEQKLSELKLVYDDQISSTSHYKGKQCGQREYLQTPHNSASIPVSPGTTPFANNMATFHDLAMIWP